MASFSFEEEALASKLNFSSWGKIARYAFRRSGLLVLMMSLMLLITFHDGSLIPLLNRAVIRSVAALEGQAILISDLSIHLELLFGLQFTLNFTEYVLVLVSGILLRSIAIYVLFFVTNF